MNSINDFFYTAWSSEPVCAISSDLEDNLLSRLHAQEYDSFCDRAAMILSLSASNREKFLQIAPLVESLKIFSEYPSQKFESTAEISAVQCRLLSYLISQGNPILNKAIGQRLDALRKGGVIGYDTARKLISILTLIPEKQKQKSQIPQIPLEDREVHSEKDKDTVLTSQAIADVMLWLQDAIEIPQLRERLAKVPEKIRAQRFSIGVTGVMNAGKSTMLNALLGEEILGTAVVPETANLTLIKYASKPKAKVYFWSEKEWQQIERSAEVLAPMQHFVEQTRAQFGSALSDYITPEGRGEEIAVEALPSYTSAAHSEGRCNLVKSVELFSDLAWVQGGVEIVDTPGLDDPVVQREEITKSYLAECDLLCHLMNVGQSATQKDVEFIIESLLYRNVAQLLVVITRIDMVSEEELSEVIAYTKSSIKARLEALEQGARFDALVARIVFIPIAGKMALWHRIGRAEEALAQGYDLNKSGIVKIEAYLDEVLFGENAPKVRLMMEASRKELLQLIQSQERAYRQEQRLLSQSAEEIEAAYVRYQEEQKQSQKADKKLHQEIALARHELESHFGLLQKAASEKFRSLQNLLTRRIMDDVRYSLRKEKKKPLPQRVETMIQTGLQDGLIDLLREYRYGFQKRMNLLLERMAREFEAFSQTAEAETQESAKALFEKYFDLLSLTDSHAVLTAQTNQIIAKSSPKRLEELEGQIQQAFAEALEILEEKFQARVTVLNGDLIEAFEIRYKQPLLRAAEEREAQESLLKKSLQRVRESRYDARERMQQIERQLILLAQSVRHLDAGGER